MNCITCGLLIPEPGKSYSTVLPMCQFAGNHQALPYRYPYAPNDAGSHDQQGCRPFRAACTAQRGAVMTDKQLFDAWWLEQTRCDDPDRRPNLVEDAFYAALLINKTRASELELALQD